MTTGTRRGFIIRSASALFASTLANVAVAAPSKIQNGFKDAHCEAPTKGDRILVAYASEFGSTKEVAEHIGQSLCETGATVDIKWVNNVTDVSEYSAVIVGSAIQYDKWMPEASKFVLNFQSQLSKIPVAYFFCCLTLFKSTKKTERKADSYAKKLLALSTQVEPISIGRFGGVLDYKKIPFAFRIVARSIFLLIGVPAGDYRNWTAINTWTNKVQNEFRLTGSAALTENDKS